METMIVSAFTALVNVASFPWLVLSHIGADPFFPCCTALA